MMKLACIALLVAAAQAADTEAPVISLDTFTNNSMVAYDSTSRDLGNTIAAHSLASQTSSCELLFTSDNCQLPNATAWDHGENDVTSRITTTINAYILGKAGEVPAVDTASTLTLESDVSKTRGEYVFSYNVDDTSGNDAETVVFALIVRDTEAPVSNGAGFPVSQECERSPMNVNRQPQSDEFPTPFNASNYDSAWLKITDGDYFKDTSDDPAEVGSDVAASWSSPPPTDCCTAHTIDLIAQDYAGIFGVGNQNNKMTTSVSFNLLHNVKPELLVVESDVRGWVTGDFASPATLTLECDRNKVFALETSSTGKMFTDASCECGAEGLFDTGLPFGSGEDCSWQHSASSNGADMKATHNATFTVTYTAHDENGSGNAQSDSKTFTVEDTSPPTLNIDLVEFLGHSGVSDLTHYDVGNCSDSNNASTCVRKHTSADCGDAGHTDTKIALVATTAENLFQLSALQSNIIQHSAGVTNDAAQLEELATHYSCTDDCVDESSGLEKATRWFHIKAGEDSDCATLANSFSDYASFEENTINPHADLDVTLASGYRLNNVGTYVLMYQCKDVASHLSEVKCRTVKNEDHTKPIMRMVPCDHTVYTPADKVAPYVDEGAICSDQVDGMMSEKVEVTGMVVNMAVTGTYTITYNCDDSAGNSAESLIRTVVVYDDVCPTCDASANSEITTEASFPYTDDAVPCYDDINDFVVADQVTTGDLVDVEVTGSYTITYGWTVDGLDSTSAGCKTGTSSGSVPNAAATAHQCVNSALAVVACDAALENKSKRTVTVEDSMRPIINLHYMAESNSSSRGWVALALASAVAGVALIGFSSRASPVTTVPV